MARKMTVMIHKSTGKTAICQKAVGRGLLIAQFDELAHPHSHGWHLYPRSAFRVWRH